MIPSRDLKPKFQFIRGLNYGWEEKCARWWYSGGLPDSNSLNSSEILKNGDSWKLSVDLPFDDGINYHCKVQINSCETAVISGFSQSGTTITISNSVRSFIS